MEATEIVYRNSNGIPVTTSLIVANYFEKNHKHVMEAIQELIVIAEKSAVTEIQEVSSYFELTSYEVPLNNGTGAVRKYPMYIMNEEGFTHLAMGFTGEKARVFKQRYIKAFKAMRNTIQQGAQMLSNSMEQFMQTQTALMQQVVAMCGSMMQRLDKVEQQSKAAPVAVRTGVVYTLSDSKWRKFVMNICDVRIYYPHFLKVGQVSDMLRQRGLPVYQPTLYQWLRDKGYLRTEHRAYNRPSADCEKRGWMVSTWSGSQKRNHPGRQNFVPYINPAFVDIIEQEMRSESKLLSQAVQLSLPLEKEAQP